VVRVFGHDDNVLGEFSSENTFVEVLEAAANSPEGPAPMIKASFRLNRSPGKLAM
jgi:hypothetical protein